MSVIRTMATEFGNLSHLLPEGWKSMVTAWFQEDCPSFDYGGFVVGETPETATLFGKSKVRPSVSRTPDKGNSRRRTFFQ